jgi:predicted membrane GTPase involved in stress response
MDDSTPETMSQPMDSSSRSNGDGSWIESPVDDATYDLLMALSSKLEAIDTYRVYAEDGNADLWEELAEDERRHAERLYDTLRQRIAVR